MGGPDTPGDAVPHARIYAAQTDGRLSAENAHYLGRVLRLRPSDRFCLTDGRGRELQCCLSSADTYHIDREECPQRESAVAITVFLPLLKGDRFDYLLEKLVELGVTHFVPFLSRYSCVPTAPSANRIQRWENIARAAMLQSGGCLLPRIEPVISLDAVPAPPAEVRALMLHEISPEQCQDPGACPGGGIWLISGPEGGLADFEVETLERQGWQRMWLGARRLRADTAPIAAISGLHLLWHTLMPSAGKPLTTEGEPGG